MGDDRKQAASSITLEEELRECLPLVMADLSALQQVFVNLLSNAIKFTLKDGAVHLEAKEVEDGVEVRVRDTSIGIPPEDIPLLFHDFIEPATLSKTKSRALELAYSLSNR